MEDCGRAKFCLGIETARERQARYLRISQTQYAGRVLSSYVIKICKLLLTPTERQIESEVV